MSTEDQELKAIAEAKKKAGNDAFAAKQYDEAIRLYSEAIDIDPKNHVYYSNRSACHAAVNNHPSAAEDALKCLELNEDFVKAYYRLSCALLEMGQYADALQAVKTGLNKDPKNPDLRKQLRLVKAKKAASGGGSGGGGGGVSVDKQAYEEFQQLQEQLAQTRRELGIVDGQLQASQRDQKRADLTIAEVEQSADDAVMYRSIGKMFMRASKDTVKTSLVAEKEKKRSAEEKLRGKLTYLSNRVQSQARNCDDAYKAMTHQ